MAWVQREMGRWYEPEVFWPPGVPEPEGDADLDCYVELFRAWGFVDCTSFALEDGFLKIAIFASGREFDHVAKQLPSGRWSSKAGVLHDFRHGTLDALGNSSVMPRSELVRIMRRAYDGIDPFEIEENGLIVDVAAAPDENVPDDPRAEANSSSAEAMREADADEAGSTAGDLPGE